MEITGSAWNFGPFWLLSIFQVVSLTLGNPHHGGPHAEHRSTDQFSSRSSKPWPDSHSHWADIPTSEGFHSARHWDPPKIGTVDSSAHDLTSYDFDSPITKRQVLPPASVTSTLTSSSPTTTSFGSFNSPKFGSNKYPSTSFEDSSVHAKRQTHSTPGSGVSAFKGTDGFGGPSPKFKQPGFNIKEPNFDFQPQYDSISNYQPVKDSYNYRVQFEERPKRENSFSSPPSPPQSSRYARPNFDQFRPTDFNRDHSSSAIFNEGDALNRPIRHTSYPATFSDDSTSPVASSDLDYNSPLSSFEGGSDTFENPATKFKNFFVDHNSNGFKRPSRSPLPSTLSSVQPLYNEQSTTLAFEPSYDQLRPSSIRPISRHGQKKAFTSTTVPKRQSYDRYISPIELSGEDEVAELYDYAVENNEGDLNTRTVLKKDKELYHRNHPNVAEDVPSGPRDYSYKSHSSRPEFPGRYGGDARPYEYRDEGHENNENFEIVDEEDQGRFNVKGYRQPIEVKKYENKEPIKVETYGDSYGGVQTYSGGYDSQQDAKNGIVRYYPYDQKSPNSATPYQLRNSHIGNNNNEPYGDYNEEGYYVPKEKRYYEINSEVNADSNRSRFGKQYQDESKSMYRPPNRHFQ